MGQRDSLKHKDFADIVGYPSHENSVYLTAAAAQVRTTQSVNHDTNLSRDNPVGPFSCFHVDQ